jgi:predicted nuclease with TOPRIM domain
MNTSQGEYDLINSYNNLLEKFHIVRRQYADCWKDSQDLEQVNKSLVTKLSESHALIDSLKSENLVLGSKVDLLENKLKESETRLEKISNNSLENMMHTKNFNCDESELSCDYNATSQVSFINSNDEIDVQQMCNDVEVVLKGYNKVSSKLKAVVHDKESLANELSESRVLIDSLKSEKESLANDLSKSHILIDSLKSEFSVLVHNASASTSHTSNQSLNVEFVNVKEAKANFSKTPLVKQTQGKFVPTCHHCGIIGHIRPNCRKFKAAPKKENQAATSTLQGKKGKKIHLEHHAFYHKPRVMHHPRKLPSQRFIPTCHHCGKIGHIRPKCFQLNNHESKRDYFRSRNSHDELFNMVKGVITQLNDLAKSHTSIPKMKKVWVKKENTTHPLRGSGGDLTLD